MKPWKGMKQKVGVVFIKSQPKTFHDGKYDVEGIKYVDACKKEKETTMHKILRKQFVVSFLQSFEYVMILSNACLDIEVQNK